MDTSVNNFLLAVHIHDPTAASDVEGHAHDLRDSQDTQVTSRPTPMIGLAWIDLSTGDFFTQSTQLPSLLSAVARIGPREIILGQDAQVFQNFLSLLEQDRHAVSHHRSRHLQATIEAWLPFLENAIPEAEAAHFTVEEVAAGSSLLDYIEVQLQGLQTKLQAPIRRQTRETMSIDRNSMRALEIKTTLREGVSKGSLLHAMRMTVTNSGARLLNDWLSMLPPPPISSEMIVIFVPPNEKAPCRARDSLAD